MNEMKDLIKIEISNIQMLRKPGGKKVFVLKALFILGVLSLVSISSYVVLEKFREYNLTDLAIPIFALLATGASVYDFIVNCREVLYSKSSFLMLAAFPIRTSKVVLSKLFCLYLLSLRWEVMIRIPVGILFGIRQDMALEYYLLYGIGMAIRPAILSFCGAAAAAVFFQLKKRFRILLYIGATGCGIAAAAGTARTALLGGIKGFAQTLHEYSGMGIEPVMSCTLGDKYGKIILFLFIFVLIPISMVFVMATFHKILNGLMDRGTAFAKDKSWREKRNNVSSLTYKEERGYWGSGVYVTNTIMGLLIFTVGIAATLFLPEHFLQRFLESTGRKNEIMMLCPIILAFLNGMACSTYCSISYEGKCLGLVLSFPISREEFLKGKLLLYLKNILPFTIVNAAVIFYSVYQFKNIFMLLCLLVVPFLFSTVIGIFGLFLDLSLGGFDWVNVLSIVKQSAALPLMMGAAVILTALPAAAVLMFHVQNSLWYVFWTLLLGMCALVLWNFVKKRAAIRLYL